MGQLSGINGVNWSKLFCVLLSLFLTQGCAQKQNDGSVIQQIQSTQLPSDLDSNSKSSEVPAESFGESIGIPDGASKGKPGKGTDKNQLTGQIQFFYSPKLDAHRPVIEAINGARSSIKMKMFHLSDPDVANALIDAAKRNVDVKLILDKIQWTKPKDVALNDSMTQGGVKLVKATSGFSITHEKAMIIDENKAMVSTMNQVKNFTVSLDFGVFVTDAGVVDEMLKVFEADWQNAAANTSNTPPLKNPFLVWSPVNSTSKLVDFISSSESDIVLFVENFSSTDISNALIDKAAKGKSVRVIVPQCNAGKANFNFPSVDALRRSGVDARMMPGPATAEFPYVHAKAIVVDHKKVFMGSENFSYNSLTRAREVGIILPDSQTSSNVFDHFETYWVKANLPPADPNYTCAAWTPIAPTPGQAGEGGGSSGGSVPRMFILPSVFNLGR